ncbi:trace amine-associated receptor 13c [Biomphalaria pfeifferi]|uniref:Trace amine-associated receptor 13c n=1 Tax=Biomphalaria pfeifferi TaxID=112525 RepID=A0AAD8C3B4_BIOPF|nr:trace amine-associated receptor 13c [Biomphalaria pfeifferi]
MNLSDCLNSEVSKVNISTSAMAVINAVTSIITVFTVSMNSIIFIALVKSLCPSHNSLGHRSLISKCTMTSFVAVEILMGLFLMPLLIIKTNLGVWTLGTPVIWLKDFLSDFICTLTMVHMVTMAVDRYMAVCHPLTYRLLTSRHAYVIVALSWGVPGLVNSNITISNYLHVRRSNDFQFTCMYYDLNSFLFLLVVLMILPIMLITFLYIRILVEVQSFHRRNLKYRSSDQPDEPTITNLGVDDRSSTVPTTSVNCESMSNCDSQSNTPGTEAAALSSQVQTDKHLATFGNFFCYKVSNKDVCVRGTNIGDNVGYVFECSN